MKGSKGFYSTGRSDAAVLLLTAIRHHSTQLNQAMSGKTPYGRISAVSHRTRMLDLDDSGTTGGAGGVVGGGGGGIGGIGPVVVGGRALTIRTAISLGEQPVSEHPEESESDEERFGLVRNSGECRLMRAINEVFSLNSRRCSMGCLYSMDEIIPSGYLLLIDEQNRSWFRMHMRAGDVPVSQWYSSFLAMMQESLDGEARGRMFQAGNCHVFAGAGRQAAIAGAPLHCRRFAYVPCEVLEHPKLMLHHLPISPDQLLLVDHAMQAAAYVPVTVVVGVAKQLELPTSPQAEAT
ncbi:hypothetical protein BOX15_Mlig001568g2 [Macrostomum lignano]|uniref:Uncharacterized protein n=1 Tax=Macrostomum lignano TaxID=282301 RepID=A0A267GUJ5_9PLAT|nr:hypothetical protein BOX15_Mlig001568g2 [Macrostomum lignano]